MLLSNLRLFNARTNSLDPWGYLLSLFLRVTENGIVSIPMLCSGRGSGRPELGSPRSQVAWLMNLLTVL
jgi:hypothetical protein